MAKKQKSKPRSFVIKFVLIIILAGGGCFFLGDQLVRAFRAAEYFKVRSIVIDPSLQFINKSDLKDLFGKSIFSVDLRAVQGRLSHRYPQASDLRLVKRFPSQILIVAKKRLPFAQLKVEGKTVILDEEGVILSLDGGKDAKLPGITGMNMDPTRLVAGLPLREKNLKTALRIIKLFDEEDTLSRYSIDEVNIGNMSKIYFILSGSLQIILDQDSIAHNIKVLGIILAQKQFEIDQAKYIDLRFKEPIIGKK